MQGTQLSDAFRTFYGPPSGLVSGPGNEFVKPGSPLMAQQPPKAPAASLPPPPVLMPRHKKRKSKSKRNKRRDFKRCEKRYNYYKHKYGSNNHDCDWEYDDDNDDGSDSTSDDSDDDGNERRYNRNDSRVLRRLNELLDTKRGTRFQDAEDGSVASNVVCTPDVAGLDVFHVPKIMVWICVGVAILVFVITLLILVAKLNSSCAQTAGAQAELLAAVRQLIQTRNVGV